MFATQNVYPQVRGERSTSSRMRTRVRALPYVYIRMYACTRMSVWPCSAQAHARAHAAPCTPSIFAASTRRDQCPGHAEMQEHQTLNPVTVSLNPKP